MINSNPHMTMNTLNKIFQQLYRKNKITQLERKKKQLFSKESPARTEAELLQQKIYTSIEVTKEEVIRYLYLIAGEEGKQIGLQAFTYKLHPYSDELLYYNLLIYEKECIRITDKIDEDKVITFDEYVIYSTRKYPKLAEHQVKWYAYSKEITERFNIKLPHERGTAPYLEILKEANLLDEDKEMGELYYGQQYGKKGAELYRKWYEAYLYARRDEYAFYPMHHVKKMIWEKGCNTMSMTELQQFYIMRYGERAGELSQQKELTHWEKSELLSLIRGKQAQGIKILDPSKPKRHHDIDYAVLVDREPLPKYLYSKDKQWRI